MRAMKMMGMMGIDGDDSVQVGKSVSLLSEKEEALAKLAGA
jgi:hypothetical protein